MGDPGRGAAYSIRDVAERANVPEGFVRRLVAVGALPSEKTGLGPREVGRARLLHSWKAAGLSIETIVALADRGAISLRFLDTPVMATPSAWTDPTSSLPPTAACPWRSCRRCTRRSASHPQTPLTGPARTT
jgi:hypothetical protein